MATKKYKIKNYNMLFILQYEPNEPGRMERYCDVWEKKYEYQHLDDYLPFKRHQYSVNRKLSCSCYIYNESLKKAHLKNMRACQREYEQATGVESSRPTKRRRAILIATPINDDSMDMDVDLDVDLDMHMDDGLDDEPVQTSSDNLLEEVQVPIPQPKKQGKGKKKVDDENSTIQARNSMNKILLEKYLTSFNDGIQNSFSVDLKGITECNRAESSTTPLKIFFQHGITLLSEYVLHLFIYVYLF
jgi:hypothetical protein